MHVSELTLIRQPFLKASFKVEAQADQFFRCARADNSGVEGDIWPKFKLIQAFMHVLATCKNEDDRFTNKGARVWKNVFNRKDL